MADKMLAFHYDLKRPMWTQQYLSACTDRLAAWGFSAIVYEVEDKFRFAGHPAITHPDAPPHEETAAFVAACRAKGVEVIPLVQSLGHAEAVVGKPEYAHLREAPDVKDQYDPLSAEARALILQFFDEVIDVMQPREYFHMGGDETWSLGNSDKCADVVREIGVGGLYLRHMLPLFEHLHNRGLRPIIWADIVLAHPEIIADVPKYVVMMDWDYFTCDERPHTILAWGGDPATRRPAYLTREQYVQLDHPAFKRHYERFCVDEQTRHDGTFRGLFYADALRHAGFDVITASASRSHGDMTGTPLHDTHLPNCFHSARKGVAVGLGNLVTCWAVRRNHPELCLPGAFAAAWALGHDGPFDADALGRAFTKDFYGVEMPEFASAVHRAQVAFAAGQSWLIQRDREKLVAGEDPMPAEIAELESACGGRAGALKFLDETLAGYAEARAAFEAMKAKAKRNAHNIDFWLEGIDLNAFYADFIRAAVGGALKSDAARLLGRLAVLRDRTRSLFADTYRPHGLEEELALRYGLHERYLQGIC